MANIEQLVGVSEQCNKIIKRVGNGSLDPTAVERALQSIVEGKFIASTWSPPTWWRTPEQQLAKARKLWPSVTLPEPPVNFEPQTNTEVLLLHIPDTFNSLWDKVEPPAGYDKRSWRDIKSGDLRLAPQKREFTEPVWLAFDPEHGKDMSPMLFWYWGKSNLAASEVLSAVIQFPEWCLSWLDDASIPNLSGYQLVHRQNDDWSLVPHLHIWKDLRQLWMRAYWVDSSDIRWASPSVREC